MFKNPVRKYLTAVIFAVAIILATLFLGNAFIKPAHPKGVIAVTASGSENFTSDIIVWKVVSAG